MDSPFVMDRYKIESVAFAEDLGSIMVRFEEPHTAGGPITVERKEQEINLFEDGELRQQVAELVDLICDVVDRVHADRRHAR